MATSLGILLQDLGRFPELSRHQQQVLLSRARFLRSVSAEQVGVAARQLLALVAPVSADPAARLSPEVIELLAAVLPNLQVLSPEELQRRERARLSQETIEALVSLYKHLRGDGAFRYHVLRLLASDASRLALERFAELVATDPPPGGEEVDLAFLPLFRNRSLDAAPLFPRLLDALQYPAVATAVVDLANYVTRQRLLPSHPAATQSKRLAKLLSELVQYLHRIAERPQQFSDDAGELSRKLSETGGLFTALCDALGLIGDREVAPKLYPALELEHRRLRTEAAAALARLQDPRGLAAMEELAGDAAARTRVLAYMEELGEVERIAPEHQSPAARAEGEMANWLSQPMQYGLPPHELDLVDAHRQFWPGYDEPVDCYLFSFRYDFPFASWKGVGITGPVTHAIAADLDDFTPREIYALYAGWHAVHDEIWETWADKLDASQIARFDQLLGRLVSEGFQNPQLVKVGYFFEQELPVISAWREGQPGVVIVDEERCEWHPIGETRLGPQEFYDMHKGRKLLRTFNPDDWR